MKHWYLLTLRWVLNTLCYLKEADPKAYVVWFYSHEISRIGKSIEEMRGCQGLKGGSNVEWLSRHSGFFLWWRKYPAIRQWWWLYNLVTTLKTLKWYSLKRWISWHANYISILKIICYLRDLDFSLKQIERLLKEQKSNK